MRARMYGFVVLIRVPMVMLMLASMVMFMLVFVCRRCRLFLDEFFLGAKVPGFVVALENGLDVRSALTHRHLHVCMFDCENMHVCER